LIAVTVATLVWCVCGGFESLSRYISSGMSSDQVYRERIIRRQQQRSGQDQEKKETPEQRRTNLLQSFHRNKVHSVSVDKKCMPNFFLFSTVLTSTFCRLFV
jgi:hypothetical protein